MSKSLEIDNFTILYTKNKSNDRIGPLAILDIILTKT